MSSPSAGSAGRPPLSMRTEYAKQQQLITVGMLLLLLGSITLAVAGVVAGMVSKHKRRTAWCALAALAALGVAAWFWRDYQALSLELWAVWSAAYQTVQLAQAGAKSPDYWDLARDCWPPLSESEAAGVAALRALSGTSQEEAPATEQRPCVAPRPDASRVTLYGGEAARLRPGAVSRAHRGVLLLDDLPAFGAKLAPLAAILDDRTVMLERPGSSLTLPVAFQLVATMRPCPCGWFGDVETVCTCTPTIPYVPSGPLLPRRWWHIPGLRLTLSAHPARAGANETECCMRPLLLALLLALLPAVPFPPAAAVAPPPPR
jgi:hypothetical protein